MITVVFGALWARDAMRARRPAEEAAADRGDAPPVATAADLEYEAETDGEVVRYPRNKFLELTTLGLGGVIAAVVTRADRGLRRAARVQGSRVVHR